MNCFDHHTHTAVCICRSCGKGLCNECAHHQYNHGYYCSEICFEKLVSVDELNNSAIEIYKRNRSAMMNASFNQKLSSLFLIALGGAMLALDWKAPLFSTINIMALIMLLFGISLLIANMCRRR